MSGLPLSWVNLKLGDVIDYPKTSKAEPSEISEDDWVLELEDIEKKSSKLLKKVFFSERQSKSTKNKFDEGDVLYGKLRPYLDKVIIADEAGYCTTEIVPIKAGENIDNRFIFYALKRKEFLDYVSEVSHGLNMPRLGSTQGREAPFVLAPLNEQTRIANKLDSLLAKVDAAQTRLKKIPTLLKRFRQSVLAAATSGELTREWRDDANKNIEQVSLSEIENGWIELHAEKGTKYQPPKIEASVEEAEVPLGWINTFIGKVFDVHVGATPSRKEKDYWNGDIPWISSGEVAFCRIRDTREKITESGLKNTSTKIHPKGTVMLAMIGQGKTRGQPAILDIEASHNQNTAALRVLPQYAVTEYLYFFLWKEYENTRKVGGGNNQKALNKTTVQSLPFLMPPLKEQQEIVRRVESLFILADTVEKQYQAAKQRLDRLSQSILAKAFRGELVPQDPDDEPASELLKRIQAERAQPSQNKPKHKTAVKKKPVTPKKTGANLA